MPVIINSCPIVDIVDGVCSFIQYLFKTPEITPAEFRWSEVDRDTKIFIGAPFTITRDKVGALPTITISRGQYVYENHGIDNMKKADPITFENEEHVDILRGQITIICEAGSASEAAGLCHFLGLELQANRRRMRDNLKFLHRLTWVGISPEMPVKDDAEIKRWQCSIVFDVSLYTGWVNRELNLDRMNRLSIRATDDENFWRSGFGQTTLGSDLFVDNSANFGFTNTNNPQLLQSEYTKKWYFIAFDGDPKPYQVEEMIDNKTLRLSVVDADGNTVPYSAGQTQTGITYRLMWNAVHIKIELPKKEN